MRFYGALGEAIGEAGTTLSVQVEQKPPTILVGPHNRDPTPLTESSHKRKGQVCAELASP